MAEEFEGDLREAQFWGADLRDARFRDVDLTGASITHALVVDVTIDAFVDRLVVNGVDVTHHVNALDPWSGLRSAGQARSVAEIHRGWVALQRAWASVAAAVEPLGESTATARVDDQWSFVETLRHLVFVADKWCIAPLLGREFAAIGMPNSGSVDVAWPGIERDAPATFAETMAVWRTQAATVDGIVDGLSEDDLTRVVDVIENGAHPTGQCIPVVLEEMFWHLRYAHRDLLRLGVEVPIPS